jgi:hypothetical protein
MKLRKNNKNKSSTSVITTSDTTEATLPNGQQVKVELASRRVIKATPPPESKPKESRGDSSNSLTGLGLEASTGTEVTATELDSSSSTSEYNHGHGGSGYTTNVPSVQNEALREKTEQWRQERIRQDGVRRKENKAKDTMEHRLSGRISPTLLSPRDGVEDAVKKEEMAMELPAALSVASQFPEHKRKSRSRNIGEDAKKLKIDEDTESESATASAAAAATPLHKNTVSSSSSGGKKGESEGFKAKAMNVIKSSAPAIVVAVAAILAVRLLSGRR